MVAIEKEKRQDIIAVPKLAMSITEFCRAHGMSEKTYYNLKKSGKGPVEMHVLGRRMVSIESGANWRQAMEVHE